jgi:ABC-type bacteriocin/lantibiotic exporter with double-glycine peptidase domain
MPYQPVALAATVECAAVRDGALLLATTPPRPDPTAEPLAGLRLTGAPGAVEVTSNGVDLGRVPLDAVRRTILVSDTNSQLFAGTLQDAVDPHGVLTREQAEEALRTAAAEDVYDALPGGWAGELDERGRGLSGGQRQRIVLARAVATHPEVLVLVEPTSAVDAHTEARIAERLAAHRRGRTSVVTTVSPLWLHHADHVVLLSDGRVAAEGTHEELLATDADYRDVVVRTLEDSRV